MGLVDLHLHSNCSDGLYSPQELIREIVAAGLSGFALTDHDTFAGIDTVLHYLKSNALPLYFVPGCEFSTQHKVLGEVHILGYFPNFGYEKLTPMIRRYNEERIERAYRIQEKLRAKGIDLDMTNLIKNPDLPIGRMHFARELVRMGLYQHPQQAFDALLKTGRPCYEPRQNVNTVEVIASIRDAGGIPATAHPMFLEKTGQWMYLDELEEAGLMGVEYRHPKISGGLSQKIKEKLGDRFYLVSGSDFHGDINYNELGKYGISVNDFGKYFSNEKNYVII